MLIIKEIDELIASLTSFKEAIIIVDRLVFEKYNYLFEKINNSFVILIEAQEESKTLSQAIFLLKKFQEKRVEKSTTVIVIGGGVIQDISFFVAHIYYRGLDIVFFPTTLLAMCDSCIGSKCGLNFNGFKNQIGTFYPPTKVIIWLDFLRTLPNEAITSGYGEILKLLLISGNEKFKNIKLLANLPECLDELHQLIYESLAIKKKFIEEDEYDMGIRRLLNYGHTFGHALERATNYAIPHGVAVARGMDIVNYISFKMGFTPEYVYKEIRELIKNNFFANQFSLAVSFESLIQNVRYDKKHYQGMLNLVFLKNPGDLFMHPVQLTQDLKNIIFDYFTINA